MTASARVLTWQRSAAVELRSGTTAVVVVPELGMLIASFVVDGHEFIARPGGLAAVRAGHTTAVPLLYPWANRLARRSYRVGDRTVSLRGLPLHTDPNGLPIHGSMAARPEWEIVSLTRGRLRARFEFGAHPELLESFPFRHVVEIGVTVTPGRTRVRTSVLAGTVAVPVSFGWHPYWRVPGARDQWQLRLPAGEHLTLDRRGIPTAVARTIEAQTVALAGREFDDLYAPRGAARVAVLSGAGAQLRLELDPGYPYLQVYAPGGGAFCCLEPMTAPTNALVTGRHPMVAAGEAFTAGFTATVRNGVLAP